MVIHKMKTRQYHGLLSLSLKFDAGMHMSAKPILIIIRFYLIHRVRKSKPIQAISFALDSKT